jgi:hypothetical protein
MNELCGLIMSRVINILIKHEVGKFFKNLKLQNAIILKVNDMEKKLLTCLTIGLYSITQIQDHVRCADWGWNEIGNNMFRNTLSHSSCVV